MLFIAKHDNIKDLRFVTFNKGKSMIIAICR